MARFYPLYVRRSDGKIELFVKGKRIERNEPTAEQLDQKPDKLGVCDYYREVPPDEMKHLDWRRKLGGMLAREMGWKDKSGNDHGYILATFPDNYRLYEHVKRTEKDGKTEVKSKTHAAGGNDRQDAYLYGHPAGKRKKYRSPGDFFPHLLWLSTDESGDPDNCGCKLCSPEELENSIPGAKVVASKYVKSEMESKPSATQIGVETTPTAAVVTAKAALAPATALASAPPPPPPPVRHVASQGSTTKQEPNRSTPPPRSDSAPRQLVPTPLPQRKSTDQNIDSQYHTFMYRSGEMVWFKRGQAWGLGVILRRWITSSNQYHYSVQPLSHPYSHPLSVTKLSDLEMRPWLAWSVPKFTNEVLNSMQEPPHFETADWQGMMQKRYGSGDMEVDGSILAATFVDGTFTLFGLHTTVNREPGVVEKHYDGLFLGAEKLWAGDAVRIMVGSGTDIMVINHVNERIRTATIDQQIPQRSIAVVGDVYRLASISHSDPAVPTLAAPNNNPYLPQRLTEDLAFRNARSIPARRIASYWKLISTQARLELSEIKGRWYEASRLLPILLGNFEELARKGEIQEASLWMNARGDCVNSNRPASLARLPKPNVMKADRREAFGSSVPPGAEIMEGVDPPLPDNVDPALAGARTDSTTEIDPRFESADGTEQSGEHGALDEFMDLDGIEDPSNIADFAQSYGSQPSQNQYF